MKPPHPFSHLNEIRHRNPSTFIVQELLRNLRKNQILFISAFLVFILAGLLILRYSTPTYKVQASLLLKDDIKGSDLGESMLWQGLGLNAGKSNVDNEIEILKSRTLITSVILDLQLYIHYFATGQIKTTEIYTESPLHVQFLSAHEPRLQKEQSLFEISPVSATTYKLSNARNTWKGVFSEPLQLPFGKVIITKTQFPFVPENIYTIQFGTLDNEIKRYKRGLSISANNKFVSMVQLNYMDILPARGESILNKHMQNYLQSNMDDKNQIIDSALIFIDDHIVKVSNELTDLETEIVAFRKQNQLSDLSETSRVLIQNTHLNDQHLAALHTQILTIRDLQQYLKQFPDRIIPATLHLEGENFSAQLNRYNDLQSHQIKLLMSVTESHPAIQNSKSEMRSVRNILVESIDNRLKTLQTQYTEAQKTANQIRVHLNDLPGKERQLLGYDRQQQIKQDLYLILLKKRIETSLSKSTNLPNGRIIDHAQADRIPFSPNKKVVLFLSCMLGISVPFLWIYLKNIFNTKIHSESQLSAPLREQIIGHLHSNTHHGQSIGESFRKLRTQILHKLKKSDQVILITAQTSGVDKTYIAHQIATSLSIFQKKTLLFHSDNLTHALHPVHLPHSHNADIQIQHHIQKSIHYPNLDYLTIPTFSTNHKDFWVDSHIQPLFLDLKQEYDYIIIDCSPVNHSSNAFILAPYIQLTLFILKIQVTQIEDLPSIEQIIYRNDLPHCHFIINH